MKSIDFPQANLPLAKDQPQYQTLYVQLDRFDPEHPATMCMQLTREEIDAISRTGKLWITQITFGRGFSPIRMSVLSPFQEDPEGLQPPMDENRTAAELWDTTHFIPYDHTLTPNDQAWYTSSCRNCAKKEADHFWSSRQCKL